MHPFWTDQALQGLEEPRRYYLAHDSPEAAATIGTMMVRAADGLVGLPYLGRLGRIAGTRELVIPQVPFVLVYQMLDRRPHIVAVIHHRREWPTILQ